MYHLWKLWQEEAGLDSEIHHLLAVRKSKKTILSHVCYELENVELRWSALKCEHQRVKLEYEALDLQLAEIDGRLLVIKEVPKLLKKKTKLNSSILNLSDEERKQLVEELKKL